MALSRWGGGNERRAVRCRDLPVRCARHVAPARLRRPIPLPRPARALPASPSSPPLPSSPALVDSREVPQRRGTPAVREAAPGCPPRREPPSAGSASGCGRAAPPPARHRPRPAPRCRRRTPARPAPWPAPAAGSVASAFRPTSRPCATPTTAAPAPGSRRSSGCPKASWARRRRGGVRPAPVAGGPGPPTGRETAAGWSPPVRARDRDRGAATWSPRARPPSPPLRGRWRRTTATWKLGANEAGSRRTCTFGGGGRPKSSPEKFFVDKDSGTDTLRASFAGEQHPPASKS
jgi:hypothetical protein